MSLRLLASVACVAVIAASGGMIWANVGGTGAAQAQGDDYSPEDYCRVARDFLIADKAGFHILTEGGRSVALVEIEECNK